MCKESNELEIINKSEITKTSSRQLFFLEKSGRETFDFLAHGWRSFLEVVPCTDIRGNALSCFFAKIIVTVERKAFAALQGHI